MSLKKLEVVEREITAAVGMTVLVAMLCFAELVVGIVEQRQHGFQSFHTSEKAVQHCAQFLKQ